MSRNLTASDRKSLIRLAYTLPIGSEDRRTILAGFRVPEAVSIFAEKIREHLDYLGVQRPWKVKPFNSGLVGIVIDSPLEFGKYIYIDQPGVIGLEDQRPGRMSFGKYPRGQDLHYSHRGGGFGDVAVQDTARRKFQRKVLNRITQLVDESRKR